MTYLKIPSLLQKYAECCISFAFWLSKGNPKAIINFSGGGKKPTRNISLEQILGLLSQRKIVFRVPVMEKKITISLFQILYYN